MVEGVMVVGPSCLLVRPALSLSFLYLFSFPTSLDTVWFWVAGKRYRTVSTSFFGFSLLIFCSFILQEKENVFKLLVK